MGLFSTITLDECVAVAKGKLGLRNTDMDILLMDTANEAVRQINAGNIFSKELPVILEIVDKKAKLPCNYYGLLGLHFNSDDANNIACQNIIYVDMEFLTSCGCTPPQNSIAFTGVFEIVKGWMYFHQTPDNSTSVTLSYMGINQDTSGRMIVYEDFRRAVWSYVCYDFCLANQDEIKYRGQWQQHYNIWKAQKRWLTSEEFARKFHDEKHQIRAIMNAWVVDKRNWRTI